MKRKNSKTLLLLFAALTLASPLATASDWGPWETPKTASKRTNSGGIDPLADAVKIYQKYISPVDGDRCPMYPTCSAYARQALHKHGPLLGMVMTADRLMHEGDPVEQQEVVTKWGHRRFYDPVSYNDFWLSRD